MPVDATLASAQPPALETTAAVPNATLIKYGFGQVGGQVFRDVPASLLPLFFSTMLGVPPWLGGIAILIPKFWIVICDPLMGAFSDRKKITWGRLPFLLVGAVGTAIGFLILFTPPKLGAPWLYAVYIGGIFTLASTAFSAYSVPYLAIAAELSDQYHERTKIMVYRVVFTSVGLIIGVGVAQPLVSWFGGGQTGWTLMALILSSLSFASMMICYLGLRRVRLSPAQGEHLSLLTQFRIAGRNPYFRVLVITHFLQQTGQAAAYSALALMFIYVIKDVTLILPFILAMTITTLLIQPIWLSVSRRLGKRTTYFLSVIVWMLVTLSWFLVKPADDVLITLPFFGPLPTQHALVLFRSILIGIFNSGFHLMNLSMLTDTIEYDRRQHRVSREGTYAGVYSAVEKLAFATGPAVGGIVLSLAGFQPSTGGAIGQNADAIQGILIVYAALPVALFAFSLLSMSKLRLTEATLNETAFVPLE